MSAETCGACRWFDGIDADPKTGDTPGECHRYPPTVCGDDVEGLQMQGHPFVFGDDFCGEFMRRLTS